MNSGATSERVYDALKRRIQSGEFAPGERLDPPLLAASHATSVTPVRDVLHLLTGEGLIETRPSDGFHMPAAHEPALRDLYMWSAQLIAIGLGVRSDAPRAAPPGYQDDGIAERTAALFAAMVARSGNAEHQRAIASANDRLHRIRLVEGSVIADREHELDTLHRAWLSEDVAAVRKLMIAYHRRRGQQVAGIVRALYQADPARPGGGGPSRRG
jgi:DNA-binding GntR family transcriptional regulator